MKLFDLHCDTIEELCMRGESFRKNTTQLSLEAFAPFEAVVQTMAVFVPDHIRGQEAVDFVKDYYRRLDELTGEVGDKAELIESISDMDRITASGKYAFLRSLESGAALGGNLDNIDYFASLNFKMMGLTWNGENELGSGWNNPEQGLTDFGKKAVARMEQAGMIVDCSHLNDKGFEDLLEIAQKPFVASHSNVRACCSHRRNLTDAQFKEIVRRGGLCGVNLFDLFLSDDRDRDPDQVYRHIYHMLELGGEDVIAWGADYDGEIIPPYHMETPAGLVDFKEYLIRKGISEEVIRKLYYENAAGFFRKNTK